ncbi:hemerythrin domain-containing protein [Streptomyces sp. Je 1-332]|uniref:hemerythrin domain-containing protein n=1 Tax=Streptomyces sp. Je 1-332 TaxID=3231270 RepID=UPI0034579845
MRAADTAGPAGEANTAARARNAPDTDEMELVHSLFRREYTAAVSLVRGVGAGDTGRSGTVAGHLAALGGMLEEHHLAEDELVWPRLADDPAVDALVLRRMEQQHERIAEVLQRLQEALPRWRERAEPARRDAVADACAALVPVLGEHFADEETHILPLVPGRFTAEQWALLSERGRAAVPKAHRLYMLGALSAAAGPDGQEQFLGRLPGPVRLLWRVAGRRLHRSATARLHGA